jgi:hypothetical protein
MIKSRRMGWARHAALIAELLHAVRRHKGEKQLM